MTATDELRRLLDERVSESGYPHTLRPELHRSLSAAGIDYWVAQGLTFWNCSDGRECVAYGYQANGEPRLAVKIVGITDPEQVIEATLGRTCECDGSIVWTWNAPVELYEYELSCGHVITSTDSVPPKYCEECGAKVLEPNSNLLGREEEE